MKSVPWISILLAAALVLNPIGFAFLDQAFLSGEQLSRNIALPLVLVAAGGVAFLAVVEAGIRLWLRGRRTPTDTHR